MFLLVPAHPGTPGQRDKGAVKGLLLLLLLCCCLKQGLKQPATKKYNST